MPGARRIRPPLLAELATQLRFAATDSLVRCAGRIEALARDLEPDRMYPADFVVFRITGYRPEQGGDDQVRGGVLLEGLSALAEDLTGRALWPLSEARAAGFIGVNDLLRRWKISRKTLERRRRQGLIARRAHAERNRASLVFAPEIIAWFETAHAEQIREAAEFDRISPADRDRMLRRARRYRARFGCSLNQVAKRLAERFDRSHQGVRLLLQRHDREHPREAIFAQRGSLSERDRAVCSRAAARGLDPAWMARRLRRSPAAVRRAIAVEAAERLGVLAKEGHLQAPRSPMFSSPDAVDVFLGPAVVRRELGEAGRTDLAEFLTLARTKSVPIGALELSRRRAVCFLLWRASEAINALSRANPSTAVIDRVRTDLIWAARLQADLVRGYWPMAIETVETRLQRRVEQLGVAACTRTLGELRDALGAGAMNFDPFKGAEAGGRVAGSISQALAGVTARLARQLGVGAPASRAEPRFAQGTIITDWTLHIAPWQTGVDLTDRVSSMLRRRDAADPAAAVLLARYGRDGRAPRTLAELGAELNIGPTLAARRERLALRNVLGLPERAGA